MYFLETLQVHAPCHGGVLYSFWYWWNVVRILFMNFLNIEKKNLRIVFQYFMFSSRFMLLVFPTFKKNWCKKNLFSSAVPSGSGAFQMPTRPSASSASSSASSAASTLRGGRANLRNASVTFSLFWHEASLGWH